MKPQNQLQEKGGFNTSDTAGIQEELINKTQAKTITTGVVVAHLEPQKKIQANLQLSFPIKVYL